MAAVTRLDRVTSDTRAARLLGRVRAAVFRPRGRPLVRKSSGVVGPRNSAWCSSVRGPCGFRCRVYGTFQGWVSLCPSTYLRPPVDAALPAWGIQTNRFPWGEMGTGRELGKCCACGSVIGAFQKGFCRALPRRLGWLECRPKAVGQGCRSHPQSGHRRESASEHLDQ